MINLTIIYVSANINRIIEKSFKSKQPMTKEELARKKWEDWLLKPKTKKQSKCQIRIQKVLDHYHLDQDDTYAFGDGENDLEMIEFCRVGVAMGNACDLLKAKANIICKSVVDDGLEDILKILFSD